MRQTNIIGLHPRRLTAPAPVPVVPVRMRTQIRKPGLGIVMPAFLTNKVFGIPVWGILAGAAVIGGIIFFRKGVK